MKKIIISFVLIFACAWFAPVSAATTAKAPIKAKTAVTKKPAAKPAPKKTVSYGTAKNPIFLPTEAAKAMGTSTTDSMIAYQNALRAAQKMCIAAGSNKEKLAACDQAFKDAQLLLNQ